MTPQTNKTWRKLTVSAFQRYRGLGVWDRVIITKNASAHNTSKRQMSLLCVVIDHKSYLRNRQCSYYSYVKSTVITNTHRSITSMADLNDDIEAMLHPLPPPPGINDAPTPNAPLPPSRCHRRANAAAAAALLREQLLSNSNPGLPIGKLVTSPDLLRV